MTYPSGDRDLLQVCRMLRDGIPTADIARRLDLSTRTVRKLTRRAAVAWLSLYEANLRRTARDLAGRCGCTIGKSQLEN